MTNQTPRQLIGLRIKELREAAHITQQELADKAGLQLSNIIRIEEGRYSITIDVADAIGKALGYRIYFVKL